MTQRQSETTTVKSNEGRRTHKEILEKGIQKAIDGGWRPNCDVEGKFFIAEWTKPSMFDNPQQSLSICFEVEGLFGGHMYHFTDIIFNHDFAKALWGEHNDGEYMKHYVPARGYPGEKISNGERSGYIKPHEGKYFDLPEYMFACTRCKKPWSKCFDSVCEITRHFSMGWQFYLQHMVIADDPIAYLGEHLDG